MRIPVDETTRRMSWVQIPPAPPQLGYTSGTFITSESGRTDQKNSASRLRQFGLGSWVSSTFQCGASGSLRPCHFERSQTGAWSVSIARAVVEVSRPNKINGLARNQDRTMIAVSSSKSMIHDFQTCISCRQREEGSELIRLPDSERRTITASEQYYSRTAGDDGGLTGSKGQAVRYQFGMVLPMECGQNCRSPDRNCDHED